MLLEGKVSVVTGAARGIGRGIALTLARDGADVVVGDLRQSEAEAVAAEIRALGRRAVAVAANVANRGEAHRLVETAVSELGRLDILVNNAGINRDQLLHKMTEEDWDAVIDVNLKGVFNCLQRAAQIMREQERGRIINMSSAAWLGNVGQGNYAAAKAGVVGLTKTAARELARKNVTCNAICPGFIDTQMTRGVPSKVWDLMVSKIPMGRVGTPEDVANLVSFLASDRAGYITGEVINVGGGMVV